MTSMNKIKEQQTVAPANYYNEDEISLIDLWLILARHQKVFWAILSLSIVAGVLYALLAPKIFNYTTSIEIGTRVQKEVISPIEDPQTVLAKIQESYVPLVLNENQKANQVENIKYDIKTRVPKDSQLVVLESKGPEKVAPVYLDLHNNVVSKIQHDHQRIIEIIRKEAEIERNKAVNKLNELKDGFKLLTARESRVNSLELLLSEQLGQAKVHLDKAESSRQRAIKEATNEVKAMTLLLLDAEIDKQRQRLAELQERLKVEVADKKDEYIKQLADNQREQANQMDQISRLETQLNNLRETRALVPPMQSNEPTGLARSVIVLLAIIIGLFIGIFASFFAEFLDKAKQQVQQQQTPGSAE